MKAAAEPAVENTACKHTYGHGGINTDSRRVGAGAVPLTSDEKPAEKRWCFRLNAAFLWPLLLLLLLFWRLAERAVRCTVVCRFFWPHKSTLAAKCAERITESRGTPWQQDAYS